MPNFKVLLLDIEGTITSISFVKDELFPYAFNNVENFLENNYDNPAVQLIIEDLRTLSIDQAKIDEDVVLIQETKKECIENISNNVRNWITKDKKLTPLKSLQGLIWENAYRNGDVKGHIYPDVLPVLKQCFSQQIPIFIYSSGSVHAQKLLFSHSINGDLTNILSGYFDTNIGLKNNKESYIKISKNINVNSNEILFLTDVPAEAEAARSAGLQTKLVVREGNAELTKEHKDQFEIIYDLNQIF